MHYLFYFGHPAQYLFLRETIRHLSQSDKHKITLLIKTKDVLEDLIKHDGLAYRNILVKKRRNAPIFVILSFLERMLSLLPILIQKKPDVLVGTDATLALLGKLLGINRITIVEDDYNVIRKLADITYPYTQTILCPEVCPVGAWTAKKVGYKGYMKLGYLHPSLFQPDPSILAKYGLQKPYVLIRLSSLKAHHDVNIKGISPALLRPVIHLIESQGYAVWLSAEFTIRPDLQQYLLQIDPSDMHHVLAQALLLLSDSQSMSVEAAMLGVPSLRYSDFAGRISVLEELEHTYGLTIGLKTGQETQLITQLTELLKQAAGRTVFQERRERMLQDKVNVTDFLVWFLEEYPYSAKRMRTDPDYQLRFIEQLPKQNRVQNE